MGNCPSISLVLRTIAPALKTAWLGSRLTATSSTPSVGDDAAELAQRSGRDVRLELAADRRLELGRLHRQPVGVGGDHRHLVAAGADQDTGQHRAHVVSRGGAGDDLDRLGHRRAPGSSAAARPRPGTWGSPRRGGCAGGSSSRRCGSRRRAPTRAARAGPSRRRASGRARRAGGPAAGPSRGPRPRPRGPSAGPSRGRSPRGSPGRPRRRRSGCPRATGSRRGWRPRGRRRRVSRRARLVWCSASTDQCFLELV